MKIGHISVVISPKQDQESKKCIFFARLCYNDYVYSGGVHMPNIITHKIFAEEVWKQIKKKDIRSMIDKYPQIFYIGSNGPDFLFFHHVKPWEAYKSHALNRLGSKVHSYHINEFYKTAIACVQSQKDEHMKEMMSVYLFGHLCHWALDKTAHPYIFYRTGNCKGISAGYHHRFESMMDTMMLDKFYQMSIKEFESYKICEFDDDILKAIARIYVPVAKKVYHQDVKVHDLREALNSWKDVQKMLHDPSNIKYSIVKTIEGILHKPWAISGNIVRPEIDERFDVLNENRELWKHPCDENITSCASFMDLFEEAIIIAVKVIDQTYGSIEYNADVQGVLDILQDATYDSGMSDHQEMKYFDIIYEK